MTLVSIILSDAFREANIIPLGKALTVNQSAEALRKLNQLFLSIYGDDAGEALQDWPLGNFGRESTEYYLDYTRHTLDRPPINRRLIAVNDAAETVYLPIQPQDGSRIGIADPYGRLASVPLTLDGNGRTIEAEATLLLNTDGLYRDWFYRADLANWMRLTGVTEADQMPFPEEFDIFFTILLAMRLNPGYGRDMDEQSIAMYKGERRKFIARYVQAMPLEINDDISWPFMSTQSYDYQREYSSTRGFNRGSYFGNL